MNKDVIYIEPEDDITDIITKIENSKEKIIALVPPKKAGVFRSVVNIKLIAKAGASAEKTIVLVTTDPSIVKIAGMVRVPVTKNLQTAPAIPRDGDFEEADVETETKENLIEEEAVSEVMAEGEKDAEEAEEEIAEKTDETEAADKDAKKSEKEEKKATTSGDKKGIFKNSTNPALIWIHDHRKILAGVLAGLVVLIGVGIWAFVFAPAATVTLGIRTTTNNFSENVTFTETLADEDSTTGKFYLTQYKIEEKVEKEFEATGKKNVGEKAKGTVVVYAYFGADGGTVAINAGSSFTNSGLTYVSTGDASLSWDGSDSEACDNRNNISSLIQSGCQVSGRVAVVATEPGTNYNIAASATGWSTTANVGVYSDAGMTGGTDKTVTVVQKSDIEKAVAEMGVANEQDNKAKLLETVPEDAFVIDASFKQSIGEAVPTPAIGEQVEEGKKPIITVTTTDTIFAVDKVKVEEFISEKAKLAEGFKIYTLNNPFVENFMKTDAGYAGKLKASFVAGPRVTENDIVEVVRGKGFGTAQHDLGDIDGIGTIKIDGSYPWVTAFPNDPEKITVILETKE